MRSYNAQPSAHGTKQRFWSTHLLYLSMCRLNIEHWRQVAFMKGCVADEELRLSRSRGAGGEEVVGTHLYATSTGCGAVGTVVAVAYRSAFGRLDVAEGDWVVNIAPNMLA